MSPALRTTKKISLEAVKIPALDLNILHETIAGCERCARLRDYCRNLGVVKRAAYRDEQYWAKPVPGFGDPNARIHILGLAPGAHGANRTGRPFTGDGAGYFMYPVLHEMGLASQPMGTHRGDGMKRRNAWISSVVRCAPPGDKPTPDEVRTCSSYLQQEIALLRRVRVVLALGKIAWDGYLAYALRAGIIGRRSAYTFSHGAQYQLSNGIILLGSYHPSLRNTNTGRLNNAMFAKVIGQAIELSQAAPTRSIRQKAEKRPLGKRGPFESDL